MSKMSEEHCGLDDLIKALQILRKYGSPNYPTHCEHDIMIICGISPADVSEEDKKKLDDLGFHTTHEYGEEQFASFRFGSA